MSNKSLKDIALKGVMWSAIDRFASQGISFLVSIVIARILTPHDYGLVAMVGIFISLAQAFVDSGLSSAIVRKNDRTAIDLSTAFFANIIIGFICYVILFLVAPYIAEFYQEKELCSIVRVMGIVFFLFSFSNIQQAVLTIQIDFKTKTKISLLSVLISGTLGISLAFCGYGVWSLVFQQVVFALSRAIFLWLFVRWRPIIKFSYQSFRSLFSFGSKMLLTALINSIFKNLYSIVIGKTFSATKLGFYSRAEQFAQFPSSNVSNIIKSVSFPTMSIIQDEEDRFKANYYRIQSIISFIIFPLIIGLAAVATPFILLLLSEKWLYTAKLLQIVCFALMWYPIYMQNLNFLEVKAKGGDILKSEILSKTLGILLLILLIPMGIEAICWGQVATNIISVLFSSYFIKRLLKDSYFDVFKPIIINLLFAILMGLMCFTVQKALDTPMVQLIVGIIVGVVSYSLLQMCFNRSFTISFFKTIFKR